MDPRQFFRSFFGFPNSGFDDRRSNVPAGHDGDDNQDGEDNEELHQHFGQRRGDPFVQVFTNPLEMERFFNSQMESILKSFGINDGFFSFLPSADKDRPLRDDVIETISPDDLDQLYDNETQPNEGTGFGPVFQPPSDFSGIFGGPGNSFGGFFGPGNGFGGFFGGGFPPVDPFHGPAPFSNPNFGCPPNDDDVHQGRDSGGNPFGGKSTFSFSRSVKQSTVVLPDGTVEERRTVRDGDGNETTTVTRKMGGKTETETTSYQSDGSEERQLGSFSFFRSDRSPRNEMLKPIPEQEQPSYKSIFSKIFGN